MPFGRSLALTLAGFLAGVGASAAASGLPEPAPELRTRRWPARWVAHPTAPASEYGVFFFRRVLELPEPPRRFVVHVTADARYRLWVNGASVSSGPQWSDPVDWRYESVDIGPHLRPGRNVLAAQVMAYGESGPYANMGRRPGFLLQGDTPAERAADTGAGWKVLRDPGHRPFLADQPDLRTFIVVGPGEEVDAAQHPWGWREAGFDDSAWPAVRVLGHGQPRGWGTDMNTWLSPRTIPPLEERDEPVGRIVRADGVVPPARRELAGASVPARSKASVLIDHGTLTNAHPILSVSRGRGATVTLRYAEALVDDRGNKGHRDETDGRRLRGTGDRFLPDGGANRVFAPFDFRTFRYVQLDIETADEPLVIEDLRARFAGYPFRENASFRSDDPALARIWEVGWRTARLCALETYVDCPYYEQLQYVGDTRIQALISLYVSGDDRLMRNAIELFDRSRIPEGLTQSRYPSKVPQIINTFSLFWIDMVHDHWRHRGDRGLVRAQRRGVEGVLAWFDERIDPATGLLGPLPYWTFVDWTNDWPWNEAAGIGGEPSGARSGGSSIVTLQLAVTLRHAAELARALGDEAGAAGHERRADALVAAVRRHCWDAGRQLFADSPAKDAFSQHANIMAVLAGAIEGGEARELMKRVAGDPRLIQASTYFRFYLLRAMKRAGLGDEYLAGLGPWHEMLARGLTTFAEKPDPTRSDCHAWSASPVYELLATVAGIEPLVPGFAAVRIAPHFGHLREVTARMPHPSGEIIVALRRDGAAGVVGTIALPPGVTGEFVWAGSRIPLRAGEQPVAAR
ncbi:MAG TPA: family 78 glycoside hydrolase catalytic domain [Opitutaceae bacterium]|nr:family 78 glycoside hydrolase catalytic domain [Opitutaceae bacterium]